MPKRIVPLSDLQVSKAKPQAKQVTLFDGGGLFLLVTPSGGKLWRFKYRFDDKEKLLAFGSYPKSLFSMQDNAVRMPESSLPMVLTPPRSKRLRKPLTISQSENSFEVVAVHGTAGNVERWAESHAKTTLERLQKNIFPWLGAKPVNEIKLSDIKPVLHRIEERAPESARRMLVALNMIFRLLCRF